MKKKVGFLQESEGVNSVNRLVFLVGSIWTFLLVTYFAMAKDTEVAGTLALFSGLQGTLIALKLGQKAMEKKNDA